MARATPMAPEDRRHALVEVTLPLLLEHGRAVSTKQIAEAAGVAEGTIFRAFGCKDDLILATIEAALDLEPFLEVLATVDPELELRARLLQMVVHLQQRFAGVFALMAAMGMTGPPRAAKHMAADRRRIEDALVSLVEPDADRLTCSPGDLVHIMRLLTFSGTHPHLSDGRPLTPERIVDTLLDGVLRSGA
jgi:AcrR family transcriptional regulator